MRGKWQKANEEKNITKIVRYANERDEDRESRKIKNKIQRKGNQNLE